MTKKQGNETRDTEMVPRSVLSEANVEHSREVGELLRRIRNLETKVGRLLAAIQEHHDSIMLGHGPEDVVPADHDLWALLDEFEEIPVTDDG